MKKQGKILKKLIVLLLVLVFACKSLLLGMTYSLQQSRYKRRTMVLCHGFGGNYQDSRTPRQLYLYMLPSTSFQTMMPKRAMPQHKVTFGTIDEILPALYVLLKCVYLMKSEIKLTSTATRREVLLLLISLPHSTLQTTMQSLNK